MRQARVEARQIGERVTVFPKPLHEIGLDVAASIQRLLELSRSRDELAVESSPLLDAGGDLRLQDLVARERVVDASCGGDDGERFLLEGAEVAAVSACA